MSRGRKSKKDNLLTALKQAILQQAIQGKLTADWRAENPDIEPASKLLKRIKAEKQKLIDEKKIRKEKPMPAISAEEIPFDLPDGWVWCRLGEIYQSTSGGTPSRGNSEYWSGDIYWYKSGELNDSVLEQQPKELITNKGLKESSATLFPVGTLLIAMYGATAGKLSILNVEATTNQAVCGFYKNKHISTQYLFNYLLGNRKKMIDESWGMSQPNISQTYLRNFIFALPPLPEQTAIVQKVEALMQKCDALEKGESIQHPPSIDEPADQLLNRYAVGRQLLAELPQQQAQVKQLKQAILQEAIQGKLTADWRAENPDTEPASELLKRIKAEKQKLIDEKKIRKEKPLPAIRAEEIPFDLPDGWVWCRLGELAKISSGKGFTKAEYSKIGVKLFQIANVAIGKTSWDSVVYLPISYLKNNPELELFSGDLVMALNRPLLGRELKVAKLSGKDTPSILYQRVGRFDFFDANILMWLFKYLQSSEFSNWLYNQVKGVNIPFVNQTKLYTHILPLPPLPEQAAIVQKVEALMQTCTDLETQIKQSETHATQLMQAVIKEAFETEKANATP